MSIPYIPPPASGSNLKVYLGTPVLSPVSITWTLLDGHATAHPYYVTMGTKRYNSSLTTTPTLEFSVYSQNASFIPVVGTPVKMTDTVYGSIFGGQIEQIQIANIPGDPNGGVITDVQCVSWEMVLQRRLLGMAVSSVINLGAITDTFVGSSQWLGNQAYSYGTYCYNANGTSTVYLDYVYQCIQAGTSAAGSGFGSGPQGNGSSVNDGTVVWRYIASSPIFVFTLSQYPTQVFWVKVNGVSQTFGQFGTVGVAWLWGIGSNLLGENYLVNQTALNATQTLTVNYQGSGGGGSAVQAPTYTAMTAGAIAGALMANVAAEGFSVVIDTPGPTVDTIAFTLQDTFGSALDALCAYVSNGTNTYRWYITPEGVFHFEQQGVTRAAPWNLQSSDGSDGNAQIQMTNTITREKYANAALVNIPNAVSANPITQFFNGDGSTATFQTTYPLGATPTITLYFISGYPTGGIAQTVAVQGSSGGAAAEWWWTPGTASVVQNPANAPLTIYQMITVVYDPEIATIQTYVDAAAVTARQAIEGGTGEHDTYVDLSSTLPFSFVSGMNIGQNVVSAYENLAQSVEIQTYRGGLKTGMSIIINEALIQASGTYVVDQVTLTDADNLELWDVTCLQGANIGDWKTAFKALTGGSTTTSAVASGGGTVTPTGGGSLAYALSVAGTLAIRSDATPRSYILSGFTPATLRADVKTAPTGAALVVVLSQVTTLGAVTVVATLTIAAGATSATATTTVAAVAGNFWRIDITSVGTTLPGADLTVTIQ